MTRPSRARLAIDAALVTAADAMRASIRQRGRTWRADVETLRKAVQTLAAATRDRTEELREAVGFVVERDPDYFNDDEEHVEQGMTVDYEHENEPGRAKS